MNNVFWTRLEFEFKVETKVNMKRKSDICECLVWKLWRMISALNDDWSTSAITIAVTMVWSNYELNSLHDYWLLLILLCSTMLFGFIFLNIFHTWLIIVFCFSCSIVFFVVFSWRFDFIIRSGCHSPHFCLTYLPTILNLKISYFIIFEF